MEKKYVVVGVVVILIGVVSLLRAACTPNACLANVKTVPETITLQINVDPSNETMRSLENRISSAGVEWNPQSAIRLDSNSWVVDSDSDLQRRLKQDVVEDIKPVFYVDKRRGANVPEINKYYPNH